LVRRPSRERAGFSGVVTFNLDEYLGIAPTHTQSFHHFMDEHLFSQVNISPANIHIPDGTLSGNYDAYCEKYEEAIRDAGWNRLAAPGHRPERAHRIQRTHVSLGSRTRMKELSAETIEDNRKSVWTRRTNATVRDYRRHCTILETRRILLLATGESKAAAIAKSIEGPVAASVTASALQLHRDVTFIVDEQAGAKLMQRITTNTF